jgi:hypothetical protein
MDIIMEDLGVTLMDTCMEVDVETAWSEMEVMEGILCVNNTHSGPRIEQVVSKAVNNTAKQNMKTQRWMRWRSGEIEMAKEYRDKDMIVVDPDSDGRPELHGEHVGRESRAGPKRKETNMVDDTAYYGEGLWYMDRWWPSGRTENDIKNKIISRKVKSTSLTKLKCTNLVTKRVITSKSKAGDIFSTSTGKRFRDELGEWWLQEEDLTSSRSRRDPWPSWRYRTGNSSSLTWNKEDDYGYQEAMQHLWKNLDMTKPYLESEVMEDIMNSVGEDGVKLETVEDDMVMDLEPAREGCMHVMEVREDNKAKNIVRLETVTEPEDNKSDEEILLLPEINKHIPEGLQLQVELENQHHVDQGGPQAEDRDGGGQDGEGGGGNAGGSRQELGELDDQVFMKTSIKLQLVKRKYRLKVGIRRDGLLQPTVNNFFVINSGRGAADESNQITKTGYGIRNGKRKLDNTVVLDSLAKRQKPSSSEGH